MIHTKQGIWLQIFLYITKLWTTRITFRLNFQRSRGFPMSFTYFGTRRKITVDRGREAQETNGFLCCGRGRLLGSL